jgi:hypothetical protein
MAVLPKIVIQPASQPAGRADIVFFVVHTLVPLSEFFNYFCSLCLTEFLICLGILNRSAAIFVGFGCRLKPIKTAPKVLFFFMACATTTSATTYK